MASWCVVLQSYNRQHLTLSNSITSTLVFPSTSDVLSRINQSRTTTTQTLDAYRKRRVINL